MKTVNLAILASGAGSNALNIIRYFEASKDVKIVMVASNRPDAGVLQIAAEYHIPSFLLTKENFILSNAFIQQLQHTEVDFIILAGFLWKVPPALVSSYDHKIINIHPALLPDYGGKGMYGQFVHEAVFQNKEKTSGITIHFVNDKYDEGAIIFQSKCILDATDTPKSIERKVRDLEIKFFPRVIEEVVTEGLKSAF